MLLLIGVLFVVAACSSKDEDVSTDVNDGSNNNELNDNGVDNEVDEEETNSKWEVTFEANGIKYFKGNDSYELGDTAKVYKSDGDVEYEMTITSFVFVEEMGNLVKSNEDNYFLVANTNFENVGEKELEDRYYLNDLVAISNGAQDPLTNCHCALKDSQLGALDI